MTRAAAWLALLLLTSSDALAGDPTAEELARADETEARMDALLADGIVYQSRFAMDWWEHIYGTADKPKQIIYNGVDLDRYNPSGVSNLPGDRIRLLMVEGNFGGGYEIGLDTANALGTRLASKFPANYEMWVVGRVADELKEKYKNIFSIPLTLKGLAPPEDIPTIDRSAHVLYAADLNAACPNSVIEALACGLPVVGFDTGALPEIVQKDAGKLAPYGGNPWRLEIVLQNPPEIIPRSEQIWFPNPPPIVV